MFKNRLTAIQNFEDFQNLVEEVKTAKSNNEKLDITFDDITTAKDKLNTESKKMFAFNFCDTLDNISRTMAFTSLINNFGYDVISVNDKLECKMSTAVFKFADLENYYQLKHSTKTDKNGKIMPNKAVTIFGATRFETLVNCFIRHLFMAKTKQIADDIKLDLSKITIADEKIFEEKDGECFATNSANSLEKQMNILVKFMNIDIMLKKSQCLESLKDFSMRYKTDKGTNTFNHNEVKYLAFMDNFFKFVTAEYNHNARKFYTSDGKLIKATEKTAKPTETETATK